MLAGEEASAPAPGRGRRAACPRGSGEQLVRVGLDLADDRDERAARVVDPLGHRGQRAEVRVVGPDTLEEPREVDQLGGVESLVHHEVPEQLGDQILQAQELAGPEHLRDHRAQELLLPADPREVRHLVARLVPRPDVRERGPPVEVLAAGGDVEQRQRVLHRIRHAHVDAAEGVDHPLEPQQVDVQDVVDLHPADAPDRPGHALRPAAVHAALERGVDLALPHPRDVDPQVSRERHEHDLPAIGPRVHEDDRVRAVLAADVRVGAERDQFLGRQALAGVAAEQQVVARALVASAGDVPWTRGPGGRGRQLGDRRDRRARPEVRSHDDRGDHRDERGDGRGAGQEDPSHVRMGVGAGALGAWGVAGWRRRVRWGHRLGSGTAPFPRTRAYP